MDGWIGGDDGMDVRGGARMKDEETRKGQEEGNDEGVGWPPLFVVFQLKKRKKVRRRRMRRKNKQLGREQNEVRYPVDWGREGGCSGC